MNCHAHRDKETVASCVVCGRGVCAACVSFARSGKAVCSHRCDTRARERILFIIGWFLILLAGLLVTFSVYIYYRQAPFLAVMILLHGLAVLAVGGLLAGTPSFDADKIDTFTPFYRFNAEIRWRAGLALRAGHECRAQLSRFLEAYHRFGGAEVTVDELAWAEDRDRREIVERIWREYQGAIDDETSSRFLSARALDRAIGMMHWVGWVALRDYVAKMDMTYQGHETLLKDLIDAAWHLEKAAMHLGFFADALAKKPEVK